MLRKFWLVSVSLLTLFALVAFPYSASASHSWGNYHWARKSNSFTLMLGNNVSGTWSGHLATASADWSQSAKLDTTIVTGGTTGSQCQPTSGRVEVCNASYGPTGWLGVAQIWITVGAHIIQGTVKNNDTYFNDPTYPYNNEAEKLHVMCQEIGHTFGLDHQDESGISLNTCMDYYHNTSDSDTQSTHPNQHDYDQLAKIYKHKDRFTTVGAATPAGFANADMHAQENWGELIRTSADGRASLYVRDFGGGHKVFTFVFWAQ